MYFLLAASLYLKFIQIMLKSKKNRPVVNTDYDIFIKGETIDLCVPSDDKWVLDQWYRWFNRDEITAYLAQGIYPNTLKSQKAFYDTLGNNKSRSSFNKTKRLRRFY